MVLTLKNLLIYLFLCKIKSPIGLKNNSNEPQISENGNSIEVRYKIFKILSLIHIIQIVL